MSEQILEQAVHSEQPAKTAAASSDQPKDTAAKTPKPTGMTPTTAGAESEAAKPEQPAYIANNPALAEFFNRLPTILTESGHSEMWGVPLQDKDIPTANVLIKFLRANEGNVHAAEYQLEKALKWRKEVDPLALATSQFNANKFAGLGYLTTYQENGWPLVFTWNIYGAVKDINLTFGDVDEFVKWRAALMELAVQGLNMKDATTVIDDDDPYQMIQVHDYQNWKFINLDPIVRAATRKTIAVFSTAYPELLREKFFVNVPAIMGWMFSAMRLIMSRHTVRKFHPIASGENLAREFPDPIAEYIPVSYGGKGPELMDGARTVQLVEEKKDEQQVTAESAESAVEPVAK